MALRPYALLPRQYDERKVLATTVDAWGRALWLICEEVCFPYRWRGRDVARPARLPFDALLVISDGARIRERTLHGVAVEPAALDALPRGGVILHGRGLPGERNGQVFGPNGRPLRRFALGSHLLHLVADRRSNVWTGYADEGIFGGDPVSSGALVRWDARGNRVSDFRPPEPRRMVGEISAVNVTDSVVRAACPPGYPYFEQRVGEPLRIRELPVVAPYAFVVAGERLLLLGARERGTGHTTHLRTVHHCRLTDDGAVIVDRGELTFPNGNPVNHYPRPVCRGPHLYLHTHRSLRQWYRLTLPGQGARDG
ncbi:hypothetical protein ACFV7Q_12035 [Streptomyces sp. NPDC059851]|uniref:hypothetical protein n=1 Tax=Streptomyces sp. NPDC059851 TaxID=3346971 RepID=UPI00365965FA